MDLVELGRTGLKASIAGLGCGGHSRLGQATGRSEKESIEIVKRALDLGVNFIDTARVYGTEAIVGKAIAVQREEVVLSTKAPPRDRERRLVSAAHLRSTLEESLRNLQTDSVEVFHLHGVSDDQYDHCIDVLVPEMLELRAEGKIRFLAISEHFGRDTGHVMLSRALKDNCWDVMMVGFNLLNPSARQRIFPTTIEKDIGILVMFAVRRTLGSPEEIRSVIGDLVSQGLVEAKAVDLEDPLGFLVRPDGASSVVDAAYRFTRHEPGTHVVLTGTGSIEHLEENLASIAKDPLPKEDSDRLRLLFGSLDNLSGN